MNIFQAIILGVVEGLTEFLPISSTFHLIWAARIMHLAQTDFNKLFEVFIQSGAIFAVVLLYWKTFLENRKLMLKVLTAFIPTAIVGLLMYKIIKDVFFTSANGMLSIFIAVGLFFILFEIFLRQSRIQLDRDLDSLAFWEAAVVGLAQSLAIMPGVSRAGAVIVVLMFFRFKRSEAAKFSFLLAVPTIFAASALDAFKMKDQILSSQNNMLLLVVGSIVAFITALVVIKWFISYLQKHSLIIFGWYRIIVGFLLLIFGVR